ncbi:MAG: nuclear transport factor 2 family protein [Actinomycetota bacterium]|nr:nuclear transport factor 2 family protein [Actinomycetota bacterium]
MDIHELSDRAEIADLITRYTRHLDQQQWTELGALFTTDAHIDYGVFGGSIGNVEETLRFLAEAMPTFTKTQHMLGLPAIDLDGDRATAATPCHNPMVMGHGKESQVMVCSLWYHHEFTRTPAGWRIASLREERNFMHMLPGDMPGDA